MVADFPSDLPDGLLAGRAADGDSRAFEALVRRHTPLMRAYATRLTGSATDADDVVQDAFITAWNTLDSLREPDAVKGWLMRIVSRKAIDRMRRSRPESSLEEWDAPAVNADPEQYTVLHTQLAAVGHVLVTLPHLQRECWILREIGGYSYQDIADELAVPLPTVRGALGRARQALIRGMEDWT